MTIDALGLLLYTEYIIKKRGNSTMVKNVKAVTQNVKVTQLMHTLKDKIGTTKLSDDDLNESLLAINELGKMANQTGQTIMFNQLKAQHSFTTRLIEDIVPVGFDTYVSFKELDRAIKNVNKIDVQQLMMKPLAEYTRFIPASNRDIITSIKDKFDDIYILYTDQSGEEREIDARVQKEKDPIAFGMMSAENPSSRDRYLSDKLVFLTDWVDEYSDLTLDKLVSEYDVQARSITEDIFNEAPAEQELKTTKAFRLNV